MGEHTFTVPEPEVICETCGIVMPVAMKARLLHRRYHEDIYLFMRGVQSYMQETDTRLRILEAWARDAG